MMIYSVENLFKLLVIFISIALPLIAFIDILRSQFKGNDKLMWVIVILMLFLIGATFNNSHRADRMFVLLLPLIGAILYFIFGKRQKIK